MTDDELDRLADYCAGLLDPAEEAEIDRLIATDPRWSRAHTALTAAAPLVDRALTGLAQEPMPADVAVRLDRALRREASGAGTGAVVVDLGRARLWRRAALATTTVAAAVAVCFGGFVLVRGQGLSSNNATSTSAGDKAAAPRGALGNAGSAPALSSGLDYNHDTLGRPPSGLAARAPDAAVVPGPSHQAGSMEAEDNSKTPAELARLTDPAQLRSCLDLIVAVEGGRVTTVDLARYQGRPAVVVMLFGGRVTGVAAGPDCGLPGAGPAIIDTAP